MWSICANYGNGVYAVTVVTFRLQYEDDYEYRVTSMSLLYWAWALGLQAEHFRIAHAQNFRLVLVVVFILQSERR